MRRWIEAEVASGCDVSRLVYVGDMSIFTEAVWDNPDEIAGMLQALGSPAAPANGGTLYARGFWKMLDADIRRHLRIELTKVGIEFKFDFTYCAVCTFSTVLRRVSFLTERLAPCLPSAFPTPPELL